MSKDIVRSIRLEASVYRKIKAKAKADDRTFSSYVAKLLKEKAEEK